MTVAAFKSEEFSLPSDLELFQDYFKGRDDVIAVGNKSARGDKFLWQPLKDGEEYKKPTPDLFRGHLDGNMMLGVYPLLKDNSCNFVAADFDKHKPADPAPLSDIQKVGEVLQLQEIPHIIVKSKSGKGYHVYLFFSEPVPAWKARGVMFAVLEEAGIPKEGSSFDRLFPNQDQLSGKGIGNLIGMPFHGKNIKKGNGIPLDPDTEYTEPFDDPWAALGETGKITPQQLDALASFFDVEYQETKRQQEDTWVPHREEKYTAVFSRILNNCKFMRHWKENGDNLSEPDWYAGMTNAVRCRDGRRIVHKYSEPYPGYSKEETDRKIEHALKDTGPYTCETISSGKSGITSEHCKKCPHKRKITSPIQLGNDAVNDELYIDTVKKFNEKHFVVLAGSQCVVGCETIDSLTKRPWLRLLRKMDFFDLNANKKIPDPNNPQKEIPAARFWFEHSERRQKRQIVFEPDGAGEDCYNLWQGFAVEAKEGDWNIFREHIFDVIANGDEERFKWILAWFARIVQKPGGNRPGTAIVLQGEQGTGKGKLMYWMGKLFQPHYLQIAHQNQLTGRFNSHLGNVILLFVDEGFWAGSKQDVGALKNLITEPELAIEQKHKDLYTLKNNLNIVIASNEERVVPAGAGERRFSVFQVSKKHKEDAEYFRAIDECMKSGGLEAMMFDLLHLDIKGVNLRQIEKNENLLEQKIYSLPTHYKYWLECLSYGTILLDMDTSWETPISPRQQYEDYLIFCEKMKERHPLTEVDPIVKTNFGSI